MIKKSKFKLLILSLLLPILLMGSSISAFAKSQQSENISDNISESVELPKNKIEEKNGTITINGKPVHYVPDNKIKISSDSANNDIGFVKPEELCNEEIVCQLFPEGFPRPTDIRQGDLGACVFLAAISSLAENNPDFIKENLIEYNNDFVIVKFFDYYNGSPIFIMVQKTIPNMDNDCAFLSNNCLWVHMYLKAYVAMELVIRKIDSIEYENISYSQLYGMSLTPKILTGWETNEEPWYTFDIKREYLYKKIEKTLNLKGIVICEFADSKLCKIPFLKYFFKGIEYQGMQAHHAYSVLQTCKDKSGVKWVCCRNPWGCFVPDYDKDGKLSVNDGNYTGGYFWLKLKDFHKNCDKIYFSTEKNISGDATCK